MKKVVNSDSERFRSDAPQYAAYLEAPDGRLRLDVTFANLRGFLDQPQAQGLTHVHRRPVTSNGY